MTTVTHSELMSIAFSKLLKVELSRFATRVIGIVQSHNPEELHINKIFDELVAQTPSIMNLKDKYGPHPLTEELKDLRKSRALYVSAIKFRLKVVIREDESGENEDVNTVKYEINHFLDSLKLSRNEEMFNQKVTQFFAAIENNAALSNALASLEFGQYLDRLKDIHTDMQSVITAKLISIAKRPQETTAQLTKVVLTAIKNMIKQIEIAPLLNPTLNYTPLYNELNQLLTEYRDIISRRASNNKRRAEKMDVEQEEPVEVPPTTEVEEPAETMFHVIAEEPNTKEVEHQPLEKRKAVAMSSRLIHPHLVYDNGD